MLTARLDLAMGARTGLILQLVWCCRLTAGGLHSGTPRPISSRAPLVRIDANESVGPGVAGVAVGVLDAGGQAAHVPAWTLAQREDVAAGETGRVAVVLFAETGARSGGADGTGLVVQWAVVSVVQASMN